MPRSRRTLGPRVALALVAVSLTWMVAGCAYLEPTEDVSQAMPWDCYYDPSMNENWHDDVTCRRGTEAFRPILLEGQFVTEADMVAAGEAYEVELNRSVP